MKGFFTVLFCFKKVEGLNFREVEVGVSKIGYFLFTIEHERAIRFHYLKKVGWKIDPIILFNIFGLHCWEEFQNLIFFEKQIIIPFQFQLFHSHKVFFLELSQNAIFKVVAAVQGQNYQILKLFEYFSQVLLGSHLVTENVQPFDVFIFVLYEFEGQINSFASMNHNFLRIQFTNLFFTLNLTSRKCSLERLLFWVLMSLWLFIEDSFGDKLFFRTSSFSRVLGI